MVHFLPSWWYLHCMRSLYLNQNKELTRAKKKAWLCERYTQWRTRGVMAVRSPQSQIGDWNKKCYQISFLILFILWLTVSRQCYCFGKWWLVSGFGWKCHKKWQLALSELFTYGINHVGRRNPPEWLSAGDFQSFMIAFIKFIYSEKATHFAK